MSGVGAADVGDAGFGKTEEPDLSLPDEIADRAGNVVDRDRGVDPVLIEEVDVIGLEPAQRAVHGFANVPRPAVPVSPDLLAALDAKAEFGRDHDLVATAFERPAEELLVGERPIDLGGVEEGAAELDCAMKRRDRTRLSTAGP